MSSGASKVACTRSPSARASSVSPVGTRCRASSRPVSRLFLHRIDLARSDASVSVSGNTPFRPNGSVSARRKGAIRTENSLPACPKATFLPETPSQPARTPLSALPTPIRQAKTHLSDPAAPILLLETCPSDPFCPSFPSQPTQTKLVKQPMTQRDWNLT
jgi:hypothetical protein